MKKIVVIASVKNECDIIESFCRYNLTFCDIMLIYEGQKSSDNTRGIIQKLIDEGLPICFEAEENDIYYETVKGILTNIAVKKYKADLVVQLDADEFLCHIDGINPREILESLEDNIEYQIPWRTYVYEKDPDDYTRFMPDNFTHYRNPKLEEAQGHAGKTLASRYLLDVKQARFEQGGHWLKYPEEYEAEAIVEMSEHLICAHYPIRSRNQVMNKSIPNWINKWTMPEAIRPLKSDFSTHQLAVLFSSIKETGEISTDKMKEISITYSLNNYTANTGNVEELLYNLKSNLLVEGKLNTSYCNDKLTLKYTDITYSGNTLLQATLRVLDSAITNLDSESRSKSKEVLDVRQQLIYLKSQLEVMTQLHNDLTNHHYELSQQHNALAVQHNELVLQHNDFLRHHNELSEQNNALTHRVEDLNGQLSSIYQSRSWRIGNGVMRLARLLIPRKKVKPVIERCNTNLDSVHGLWSISDDEKQAQNNHVFDKDIRISILVPLYNTPEGFLLDMIDSVFNQTYTNWELCLADASDSKHKYVREICKIASQKHGDKIKYKKLRKNYGIAQNTNECINLATGDYYALLDHDDALHPCALFECMKAICEKNADFIYSDECKFTQYQYDAFEFAFKPDFAPDTLRGSNYICHLTVFNRALTDKAGVFRLGFDGSQDYDLFLRLTEKASCIVHIPKLLYFWRVHQDSAAASTEVKLYAYTSAVNALKDHLDRINLKGDVQNTFIRGFYHICYELKKNPLISIIIPNMDHVDDLDKCLKSIFEKTSYPNFEVLVIENNSKEPETFEYYKTLENNKRVRILKWDKPFNYSKINNFAVNEASGEYVVLLNNDTEVITENWLEEMLMFAQRDDVGAVGAMLYYPDDTVQHAGAILGVGGIANHAHLRFERGNGGYFGRMIIAQNMSCITAACMMLPKDVFLAVGGMSDDFAVAFNDIDLCMKIRKAGYLIVWTPFAELYHYESKTRGYEDTPEKYERFKSEVLLFQDLWSKELEAGDPYYNVNLSLDRPDFSLKESLG